MVIDKFGIHIRDMQDSILLPSTRRTQGWRTGYNDESFPCVCSSSGYQTLCKKAARFLNKDTSS